MARALPMTTERSRWIPWAFLAFFAVVLLANGTMIWLAFATWTGLETEGAYQKGLAYNRTLEQAEAQAALGWRVDLALEQQGRALALRLMLVDRHGSLIEEADVTRGLRPPDPRGPRPGRDDPAPLRRRL